MLVYLLSIRLKNLTAKGDDSGVVRKDLDNLTVALSDGFSQGQVIPDGRIDPVIIQVQEKLYGFSVTIPGCLNDSLIIPGPGIQATFCFLTVAIIIIIILA